MARQVWKEFVDCSMAQPHSSDRGLMDAMSRAARRMSSAATHVISSARSGGH